MNTEISTSLGGQLIQYVIELDWAYILTFIFIAYWINTEKVTSWIKKLTGLVVRTRYRVAALGLIYGIIIFYLRGYDRSGIELLFRSFIFALVFHKLIIDTILSWLTPAGDKVKDELPNP
ncbi:hypothetical protein JMN32_00100 [Fulvivirga sp. 29W222]|uniref:Uncharacterized protein n=1 Tax=Fulvivirga marina TaxID=2494733 RepID=A0A937FTQ5_9BACT|nr:hypothetical protein [Fulvivirga marina]MBL6444688.1 hypothetical protein [Fulvivirga marina]